MMTTLRRLLLSVSTVLLLAGVSGARADLISTDKATAPAASERERVKALVERPEVARKLQELGVLPKDASARVDALTDQEISQLAARIDALPAGAMSTQDWLLVIIAVLLVIIIL